MWYELGDIASGNLIADFASEAAAVEAACTHIAPNEDGPAVDVSLIVYDDEDRPLHSLEGEALAGWLDLSSERLWTAQFAITTEAQWARMVDQVRRDIADGDTTSLDDVFPPSASDRLDTSPHSLTFRPHT